MSDDLEASWMSSVKELRSNEILNASDRQDLYIGSGRITDASGSEVPSGVSIHR